MEFADSKCYHCGTKWGNRKPTKIIRLTPPFDTTPTGRAIEYVAPCPKCGKNVPLWAGLEGEVPDIEPGAELEVKSKVLA